MDYGMQFVIKEKTQNMILENESRAGKSAVYATSRLPVYYSNSQIQSCYYTFLYWYYGSIWFYMCSTALSP